MPLENILLADDNEDDVLLLEMAFNKAGLAPRIIAVSDGEKVLQYLKGETPYSDRALFPLPQLLLLDLDLPRMTGLEVLAWLQTLPEFKDLLVIVLTGSSNDADVRKAYALGAYSFLRKPPNVTELAMAMKNINQFWRSFGEPASRSAPPAIP